MERRHEMALYRLKSSAQAQARTSQASLSFESLEPRMMLASDLYITEFSASNDDLLSDGDGNSPDWIEIFNNSSTAVDLSDYYLTDDATDLTKWNMPAVSLDPGQFMVFFASDQPIDNYVDAGGFYHTNFAIAAGGEYLAATFEDPNTSQVSVVHEYAPSFPSQFTDVSYGLAMEGGTLEVPVSISVETDVAPFGGLPGDPYTPTFPSGGPSSTDLINGMLPVASSGDFETETSSGGLPVLTDGSVDATYGDGSQNGFHEPFATAGGGAGTGTSVTYALGDSFDLSEIVIYGGWVDGGRDEQHYELLFSNDNGSSYQSVGIGQSNPGAGSVPAFSRISFAGESGDFLVADATHVRVDFLSVENGFTGYMEIDVFEATGFAGGTLVDDDTPVSYLIPTNGSLGTTWTEATFDDSSWSDDGGSAAAGVGYENNPGGNNDYSPLLDVTVTSGTTSVYTRFEFDVTSPNSITALSLGMLYDDGFVAYLNGVKVADANAPANPAWNSIAGGDPFRTDEVVLQDYVDFDISQHVGELQAGANVLAIQALNLTGSSDMLMVPRLIAATRPSVIQPLEQGFFNLATPGSVNAQVFQGFVADTKFSVDRGFYSNPFDVSITTDTPAAFIAYTTDGSVPTVDENLNITNGALYSGAINISATTNLRAAAFKADFAPTNVDTQTYIFLDDVLLQTSNSQEAALEQGLPSNAGDGVDFGLDSDILNSFTNQELLDSLTSIPTISLTIENSDFLGSNGIWSNPTLRGPASERAVSAELIHPDGTDGFQIDAGLRIQGDASRVLADKKSFRLAFRSEYGTADLFYPLFGDGVDRFDTIVLRSVFNDGYGWTGDDFNLREQNYVRDLWFRESQAAMGHPASRGNWVHLYVNGQYWGLYHPSERPDKNFAEQTIGGDKDDWDAINHDGVVDDASENDPNNNVSANTIYNTARSLVNAVVNASGTANQYAAYQQLQGNLSDGTNDPNQEAYLHVQNYIDYIILNIFGGNDDWPTNNWYANRLRGPESEGFRFFSWDSEISLGLSTRTNVFENFTGVNAGAAEFYGILRGYEEFVVQFGDSIHKHLFNDGVLAGDNPANLYSSLADDIRDAIIGESARWGDQHFSNNPLTQAEWESSLNDMLTNYFVQRPAIALGHFIAAGLYPDVEAPEYEINGQPQHGGAIVAGATLTIDQPGGPQGTIYYTTDGSDPRLVGGAINTSSAIQYTSGIPLNDTTALKARILFNGEWSALSEANFLVNPAAAGNLAITEINYNPYDALPQFGDLDVDNDEFEFIELRNVGAEPIDLAGVQLVDFGGGGVEYTFAPQVLNVNEYILVVENQAAFQSRYGTSLNVAGVYSGRLSNGGELITLRAADGSDIQSFTYDDGGSWPGRSDGTGSALEIVDPFGDYDSADNWRSSSEFGGSPGSLGAGPIQDVIVNEVLSSSNVGNLDLVELYNPTGSAIDLDQWYLSDTNNDLFKFQFSGSTVIGSGQYLVFDENQLGFALDGSFGEDVWLLESELATGKPIRFADHVEFDATDIEVSLGRWANGSGDLFPMTTQTFGSANSGPFHSDVLISEVHYHPAAVPPAESANISQDELEFIEITNSGSTLVDIGHWKVDGIEFTFPASTILAVDEAIVVVTFDPTVEPAKAIAFRNVFGIGAGVRLFGAASGQLNNAGERVKLLRPEDPIGLQTGDVLVDAVRYDELAPWPTTADGGGESLHRMASNAYGGFVTSWQAAGVTPGSAILNDLLSADFNNDSNIDGFDFLTWQRGLGISGTANPQDGDANGDHQVDSSDLAIWESQYGTTSALLASSVAVEKATAPPLAASLPRQSVRSTPDDEALASLAVALGSPLMPPLANSHVIDSISEPKSSRSSIEESLARGDSLFTSHPATETIDHAVASLYSNRREDETLASLTALGSPFMSLFAFSYAIDRALESTTCRSNVQQPTAGCDSLPTSELTTDTIDEAVAIQGGNRSDDEDEGEDGWEDHSKQISAGDREFLKAIQVFPS